MNGQQADKDFVTLVDIEVDSVRPERSSFVLRGRGSDRSDYQLEMHLDFPVDRRTQTVLGEMLAQSEWRILRRSATPLRRRATARSG